LGFPPLVSPPMSLVDPAHLNLESTLYQAHNGSLNLGNSQGRQRSRALRHMARALDQAMDDILEANTLDLEPVRKWPSPN